MTERLTKEERNLLEKLAVASVENIIDNRPEDVSVQKSHLTTGKLIAKGFLIYNEETSSVTLANKSKVLMNFGEKFDTRQKQNRENAKSKELIAEINMIFSNATFPKGIRSHIVSLFNENGEVDLEHTSVNFYIDGQSKTIFSFHPHNNTMTMNVDFQGSAQEIIDLVNERESKGTIIADKMTDLFNMYKPEIMRIINRR